MYYRELGERLRHWSSILAIIVAVLPATNASARGQENERGRVTKRSTGRPRNAKTDIQVNPDYFISRADANRDGKISREEAPPQLRRSFRIGDTDGDGSLSREEVTQLIVRRERFEQMRLQNRKLARLPDDLDSIHPKTEDDRTNLSLLDAPVSTAPITVTELDQFFEQEHASERGERIGRRIADEQFVRRVYLDVIGRLPAPGIIASYVKDGDAHKKANLVDRLLEMPQFGQNWARYWRDVIQYRATAAFNRYRPFDLEPWLAEQFNENKTWAEITTALIGANGLSPDAPEGMFLAAHEGKPEELAGETARVFLGVQISCAQCHDHPTDFWTRDQFHELASFFGRTSVRVRPDLGNGPRRQVVQITENRRQPEYRKPNLKNPSSQGEIVTPAFLSGQPIPRNTSDIQRREALAQFITSTRNPFFAKAFVNRIWAELVGAGFTNPVDDLGTDVAVRYPQTFDALAQSFAASGYDIKRLMRTVLLSNAYGHRMQSMDDTREAAPSLDSSKPTRLTADQIFDALDWVLMGGVDDGRQGFYRRPSGRLLFQQVFGFDPSTDASQVEGTIPQALALMNNPSLQQRMSADNPTTLLGRLLRTNDSDRDVIAKLYLRVLARKPTPDDMEACRKYLDGATNRGEAYEDILWALLNSTEFMHNH